MIEARAKKLFVLGMDAMDPFSTKKYMDRGVMPNLKRIYESGAGRADLMLLGCLPTVTPPQWTTLATGAFPGTHNITSIWRQGKDLDLLGLNFDSTNCKAEPLWNVAVEAGKRTLVWHWPGASWPPTSDSELLHVVDGTSPSAVGTSTIEVAGEHLVIANVNTDGVKFQPTGATTSEVPCVVKGLGDDENDDAQAGSQGGLWGGPMASMEFPMYIMDPHTYGQGGFNLTPVATAFSYIRDVDTSKWEAAPADAKEFVMLLNSGLVRRYALILKNEDGVYDSIAVYKSKKDTEPIFTMKEHDYIKGIIDDCAVNGEMKEGVRDFNVMEIAPDGSQVRMWVSAVHLTDLQRGSKFWSPKELYAEVVEQNGFPPAFSSLGLENIELISDCMLRNWDHVMEFQADSINYLLGKYDYDVVFSHYHGPDAQKHMFIRDLKNGTEFVTPEQYDKAMELIHAQADRYIGKLIHLLDEGWSMIVVSDHGQVCPTWGLRGMGDTACNIQLMEELGLTVLQRDENGNRLPKIDWSKTIAVANREMYIYMNTTDKTDHGIIDPADQYEWEEEVISRLYGYRDPVSNKRIIAFALRRKDAAVLGLDGDPNQCGDIVYAMAEGYEHDHADTLATSNGECDTSASPMFFAVGPGFKQGHYVDRHIRQVDVAPTIATVLGLRMPAQCEGAPIYQILDQVF
ncbi:MAG: alkaline phosphatase family protein [Peptococcaceae bacterium]|nr:alkaline phosphatase family protein [Peptococcaceae bacterium]